MLAARYYLEFLPGAAKLNEMGQLVFLALVVRFAPVAAENTRLFMSLEMVRVVLCAENLVDRSCSQEIWRRTFVSGLRWRATNLSLRAR